MAGSRTVRGVSRDRYERRRVCRYLSISGRNRQDTVRLFFSAFGQKGDGTVESGGVDRNSRGSSIGVTTWASKSKKATNASARSSKDESATTCASSSPRAN